MELKEFHAVIEAEVEFTREELRQLAQMASEHYDGRCKAAANFGGFLYGFRNMLGDEPSVAVQVTWRQLDMLCKIAEAENVFAMIGSMPLRGELGTKLHKIIESMRDYSQAINRGTR